MRTRVLRLVLLAILLAPLTFVACQKSGIEFENDFEKSFRAWQEFKAESSNSYMFTVTGSTWAGHAWRTHLSVKNGAVTGRRFEYTSFDNFPMPAGGWTPEAASTLIAALRSKGWGGPVQPNEAEKLLDVLTWEGLEDNETAMAWPAETLDEIYARASIWLMKKKGASIYFEANNEGMISTCGYVLDGCMDDCFTGVHISSIEKLAD